jgi:hypothetical protein
MIFLSKYEDIDNVELKDIVSSYQDYFLFLNKNNIVELYLDSEKLKYYLLNGLEIKYRDYIFLFLQKVSTKSKNNNYELLNNINNYINNQKNLEYENININFFSDIDYKNLNKILYLSKKIIVGDNNFIMSNNNIIQFENNFHADILLERFYFHKPKKIKSKYNFIIINYLNEIKCKIMSLLAINNNENKTIIENKFTELEDTTQQLNTKCNLILLEKKNIKLWLLLIKIYAPNNKVIIIEKKKDLENIKNKDIFSSNFLLINYQILSNKSYINYFKKYYSNNNLNDSNNLHISIINSFHDNIKNMFFLEENINNIHLFNWNNIVYDEIEDIIIQNNKLINFLTTKNIKYYLQSSLLNSLTIDNIIIDNFDNNSNFYINNFYNIVNDILLIKNEDLFTYNNNIKKNYIDIELSDYDKKIYTIFFSNIDNDINNTNKENYKNMTFYFWKILNEQFNFKTLNEMSIITNEYYEKLINNKNITENSTLLLQNKKKYVQNIIQNFNDCVDKNCSICIEKIEDDNFCILTCGHYFCKNCIVEYISVNKSPNNIYNCPICRDNFTINNIYYPNLLASDNNIDLYINNKLKYLLEIINSDVIVSDGFSFRESFGVFRKHQTPSNDYDIIIISQFEEIIKEVEIFLENNNVLFNNLLKKQRKNSIDDTNKNSKKNIYLCTYNYIFRQKYFDNKNKCKIILLDYPEISNINNNLFFLIKNIYFERILFNSTIHSNLKEYDDKNIPYIEIYFLYYKNTIEEYIVNKIYKEN